MAHPGLKIWFLTGLAALTACSTVTSLDRSLFEGFSETRTAAGDSLQLEPIKLEVGALKTENTDPHRVEVFADSPYARLEQYFHSRFSPAGFHGTLEVEIEDARITHSFEPSAFRFGDYFQMAGSDVYDIRIDYALRHYLAAGEAGYGKRMSARKVVRVSESASKQERKRAQEEALDQIMVDLDKEIRRAVSGELDLVQAAL